MSGRKPKPTRIHILNGNPRKRPLNPNEPLPKRGFPLCPSWLKGPAKAVWDEVTPELDRLGLLTIVDGYAIACFCQACADLQEAQETIAKEGRYAERGTGGKCLHPAVHDANPAMDKIAKFAALFGLDPSSRSRLQVPPASEELDEFARYMGEAP